MRKTQWTLTRQCRGQSDVFYIKSIGSKQNIKLVNCLSSFFSQNIKSQSEFISSNIGNKYNIKGSIHILICWCKFKQTVWCWTGVGTKDKTINCLLADPMCLNGTQKPSLM